MGIPPGPAASGVPHRPRRGGPRTARRLCGARRSPGAGFPGWAPPPARPAPPSAHPAPRLEGGRGSTRRGGERRGRPCAGRAGCGASRGASEAGAWAAAGDRVSWGARASRAARLPTPSGAGARRRSRPRRDAGASPGHSFVEESLRCVLPSCLTHLTEGETEAERGGKDVPRPPNEPEPELCAARSVSLSKVSLKTSDLGSLSGF